LDYKQGYRLSIENGKALLRIADLSAASGEFGIGSSLNILAAEEIIKGMVLRTKNRFPEMEQSDLNAVFFSHKSKHTNLMLFFFLHKFLLEEIKKLCDRDKEVFTQVEMFDENTKNELKKKYALVYELKDFIREEYKSIDLFESALQWLKIANLKKNDGFYVNIVDAKWHNPRLISRELFDRERAYTSMLLKYIEFGDKLFHPFKLLKTLLRIVPIKELKKNFKPYD
jgi:AbiV family abortive infection protein